MQYAALVRPAIDRVYVGMRAAARDHTRQVVDQTGPVAGYGSFDNYVGKVLGLNRQDVVLKPLKPGAQVIAGTILGSIDQTDPQLGPHVTFGVRPAGTFIPLATNSSGLSEIHVVLMP